MIHLKNFNENSEYSKMIEKVSIDNLKGILVDITDSGFEYKIIENVGKKYLVIQIIHNSEYTFDINIILESIITIEDYIRHNGQSLGIDVTYLEEVYDWHYDTYNEEESNMSIGSIKSITDFDSVTQLSINIFSPSN